MGTVIPGELGGLIVCAAAGDVAEEMMKSIAIKQHEMRRAFKRYECM